MANKITIVINADGSAFIEGMEKTSGAVKKAETATKRWTEFLKGKMGPAMKAAMAEGLSHVEAHKKAIKELSAQWKAYKASGKDANQSVKSSAADAAQGATDSFRNMESDIQGLAAKIKEHWMSVVAVVYSLKKAWDFAEQASKVDQLEQSFVNLTASHGVNAEKFISDLRRVSVETIATADLMRAAGTAMLLGIPADKLVQMMEIARASSKITGQTIQKSFEDIGLGVARESRLILDNLGIIVKEEAEYKKFAATLGKTASQLTEAEKKQAFMNAAMSAGLDTVKRVGEQTLSAAEAMAIFTTWIQRAKLFIGELIITLVSYVGAELMAISAQIAKWAGDLAYILYRLAELGSKLPWVGDRFKGLSESLKEFSDLEYKAAEEAVRMANTAATVGSALWKKKKAMVSLTNSTDDNTKSVQANIEQKQKLIEVEQKLRAAKSASAIEDVKRSASLELKELDRLYNEKDIQAEAYYARKREIENRSYEAMLRQVNEEIAAEDAMAKAKMATLAGQPAEVLKTAELEHATRLIELADKYSGIKNEQELAELENIYALADAQKKLAAEKFNAEIEYYNLLNNSPYQNNLQNYQGENEVAQDYIKYQKKLFALQDYNGQVIQAMVTAGASQTEITARYNQLEEDYAKKKRDFQLAYAADAFGSMSNMMQNLYAATGSKNKTMFEAMKAFAIAETVIKTYQGAQEAYTALAGIPVIGPALGVAAAAAAIAAGMARIQAIRSQQPGGSASISAGGTATPTYSGGSPTAYPPPQRIEKEPKAVEFKVHFYGNYYGGDKDELARQLVEPLKKALNDGVH